MVLAQRCRDKLGCAVDGAFWPKNPKTGHPVPRRGVLFGSRSTLYTFAEIIMEVEFTTCLVLGLNIIEHHHPKKRDRLPST